MASCPNMVTSGLRRHDRVDNEAARQARVVGHSAVGHRMQAQLRCNVLKLARASKDVDGDLRDARAGEGRGVKGG
eukprot:3670250-Prymnesium_polylepis.1